MIKIKGFTMDDLATFESKTEFQDLSRDLGIALKEGNKEILTLDWQNKTLAIVGVSKLRPGAGELWLLPSIYVDEVPLVFFKAVKDLIYNYVFTKFHRLEIAIKEGWEQGYKWAKTLGFGFSHICMAYDTEYNNHIIFYKVVR